MLLWPWVSGNCGHGTLATSTVIGVPLALSGYTITWVLPALLCWPCGWANGLNMAC